MSIKHRLIAASRILFLGEPTAYDMTMSLTGQEGVGTVIMAGGRYYGSTLLIPGDDAQVHLANNKFIGNKSGLVITRRSEMDRPPETEGGEGSELEEAKAARLAELESEDPDAE